MSNHRKDITEAVIALLISAAVGVGLILASSAVGKGGNKAINKVQR